MIGRSDRRAIGRARVALIFACVAPMLVLLAVALTRTGVVSVEVGLDLMTMTAARMIAFAALAVALIATVPAARNFRAGGVYALAALALSGVTVGLFVFQAQRLGQASPVDVSTNPGDPPPLRAGMAHRGAPRTCAGVVAVPSQIAPERVTTALQDNAFTVARARLFQIEAGRQAFWFGRRYDAVVRIRPGRTDLRVTAQGDRPDGGATCRLARALIADLQPGA